MQARLATLLLVLLALLGGGAGCGGDDEDEPGATAPELTVPGEETETAPEETDTQPDATATEQSPSGTEGNGGGTQSPPQQPQQDSPENDIPPEPGTPEDRFERFCRENPGACG